VFLSPLSPAAERASITPRGDKPPDSRVIITGPGRTGPQFRLRVGDVRVFYDVGGGTVEVLAIVAKSEPESWLELFGSPVVITRHGKPAGVLVGFESEEDWFDDRLENDPRFLARIEEDR
jgi:hypothetical protein